MRTLNIYCDETAHLENDGARWMVLGAIWCPEEVVRDSATRLREIKTKHDLSAYRELKWTGVSPSKLSYFQDVLDYFFDDDDLHFRGVVIDKEQLRHGEFGHNHDEFYYKMWFTLLHHILDPKARHRVYIDIKDTQGQAKVESLRKILCTSHYDFDGRIVQRVQQVRSHEVEQVQLADLLCGVVAAANKSSNTSSAKMRLVARARERSGLQLTKSTLRRADKLNLLKWRGRNV